MENQAKNQNQQDTDEYIKLEVQGYMEYLQQTCKIPTNKNYLNPKDKIYLKFNNTNGRYQCTLTGKTFDNDSVLAFFLNNDPGQQVSPEIAFKLGFTMDVEEFPAIDQAAAEGLGILNPKKSTHISVSIALPTALKIWMGLNELFRTAKGTETGIRELARMAKQIQGILFSVLWDTKDFQHDPIILGGQYQKKREPYAIPTDSELPF